MVDTTDTTPDDDGPSPEQMSTPLDVALVTIANYLRAELPDAVPVNGIAADIAQRLLDVGALAHDGRCLRLPDEASMSNVQYLVGLPGPDGGTVVELPGGEIPPTLRSLVVQVPNVVTRGEVDPELTTMAGLAALLDVCDPDDAARMALWVFDRWGQGTIDVDVNVVADA